MKATPLEANVKACAWIEALKMASAILSVAIGLTGLESNVWNNWSLSVQLS